MIVEITDTNDYRCCCLQTWERDPVEMTGEEIHALFDRIFQCKDRSEWGEIYEVIAMDGEREFARLEKSWPSTREERYKVTHIRGHIDGDTFNLTVRNTGGTCWVIPPQL
jgi:hypothetical protein